MKRYKISKAHYNIFSCNPGQLIPTSIYEAQPGETIQQQVSALIRVSPLNTPVMHPVQIRLHCWQVPERIIDQGDFDFEAFITGGPDGNDTQTPPQATGVTVTEKDVIEYMGVSPGTRTYRTSPAAAYIQTFNEKYRDQDLVAAIDPATYQGNVPPQNIAWEKDYFTSARPWAQKGPDVSLPIGNKVPVTHDGVGNEQVGVLAPNIGAGSYRMDSSGANLLTSTQTTTSGQDLYADLSAGNVLNVNDWRAAFAIQRWQEARAQYGSRFTEYLRALGVRSSDARLQLPEYLGGGKSTISFTEILTTDSVTGAAGPGSLFGHGIATIKTRPFRRFIEEHSYILTLLSVRPKTMYMESQHKMWDRLDKLDYWQPELQAIGQEPIANKELYADHSDPNGVFGYQDRYANLNRIPSRVSGEMRSTLASWTYARSFGSDPTLNADFVNCNPTNRVYQDTSDTTDKLWCMVNHSVRCRSRINPSPRNRII